MAASHIQGTSASSGWHHSQRYFHAGYGISDSGVAKYRADMISRSINQKRFPCILSYPLLDLGRRRLYLHPLQHRQRHLIETITHTPCNRDVLVVNSRSIIRATSTQQALNPARSKMDKRMQTSQIYTRNTFRQTKYQANCPRLCNKQ